nr:hypothetical protein [Haloarchaeobius sp. FL176]
MLAALQALERELGRAPEIADVLEADDVPSLATVQDEFGSWYRALWAADITPTEPPSYWTNADIEAGLRALGDGPDAPPVTGDLTRSPIYPSLSVIHNRFESWEAALDAAGYDTPVDPNKRWTEERLLDDLITLGETLDRKPKSTDVKDDPDMAAPTTYDAVFGSWNDALQAAGYSPTPRGSESEYSDQDLVEILQSLAAEVDQQPRQADLKAHEDWPSPGVFRNRFGTWHATLEAAGVDTESTRDPKYSESELLESLRMLADRVDGTPAVDDLSEYDDLPAPVTYYRRFDSFTEALELSGVNSEM